MPSDDRLLLILRRLDEIPSVDANLLAGPCSGRHYLLTDPRQFGILRSGPGWRGTECDSTN